MSSPTRGTWIEITVNIANRGSLSVVPHAGDVDRNVHCFPGHASDVPSSPTRGTWIEMCMYVHNLAHEFVVPHAGDVDRNFVM